MAETTEVCRAPEKSHRMQRPSRATIGWALLLSIPPGVGVAVAAARSAGGPWTATGLLAGVVTTAVVFGVVVLVASTGTADESRR